MQQILTAANKKHIKIMPKMQKPLNRDLKHVHHQMQHSEKKHLQSQKVKLITDQEYCEKKQNSAKINTQRRLQDNALYKEKNRLCAKINTKQRLAENEQYRIKK